MEQIDSISTSKTSSTRKDSMHRIVSADSGLHLLDSILWFDANNATGLNYLSSAGTTNHKHNRTGQTIASEQTIRLLEALNQKPNNALVCPLNRPFSVGNLSFELLPSGTMLGAASLYVETANSNLLYAPKIQTKNIKAFRQLQLKKADTLVLGCYHPEPSQHMPSRKKEKEKLIQAVQACLSKGETPIILCKPFNTASEIIRLMSKNDIPIAAHSVIYRINKIYEQYGVDLGKYSFFSRKYTKKKAIVFPLLSSSLKIRAPLPSGNIFVVDETVNSQSEAPDALRDVKERFVISSYAEGSEIKTTVQKVEPKQVYLFGPYAARYEKIIAPLVSSVHVLNENNQPALF